MDVQALGAVEQPCCPVHPGLRSAKRGSFGFPIVAGSRETFDFPVLLGCCAGWRCRLSLRHPPRVTPIGCERHTVGSSATPPRSPPQPRSSQDATASTEGDHLGQLPLRLSPPLHPSPDTLRIRHPHPLPRAPLLPHPLARTQPRQPQQRWATVRALPPARSWALSPPALCGRSSRLPPSGRGAARSVASASGRRWLPL